MGRRSSSNQAYRRMNHSVDHSNRNKRRTFGVISAGVVLLAVTALVLALAPLFTR